MVVFELTHQFFYSDDEPVKSGNFLGFFSSLENAKAVIPEYRTKPGFRENPNGFAIRRRTVIGTPKDPVFYEAMVHVHTPDYQYDFESCFELGLFADESAARNAVETFYRDNPEFLSNPDLEAEIIINSCTADRDKSWIDGFDIYTY